MNLCEIAVFVVGLVCGGSHRFVISFRVSSLFLRFLLLSVFVRVCSFLNHQIVFIFQASLEHYGIRDVALQWIKNYFSRRQQFVQINQTCSSMQTVKCGVPQGSILGLLFFILYINDLPKASKLTGRLLFPDDKSILFSHSNPNYLENVLNNELLNIDVWLRCNSSQLMSKRQIMLPLVQVRGNSITVFLSLLEVNL